MSLCVYVLWVCKSNQTIHKNKYNTKTSPSTAPVTPQIRRGNENDRRGSDRPHTAIERTEARRHKSLRHSATLLAENKRAFQTASTMSSPKDNTQHFEEYPEIQQIKSGDGNQKRKGTEKNDERKVDLYDNDPLGLCFHFCDFCFLLVFFLGGWLRGL